jgi:hypothetical protein
LGIILNDFDRIYLEDFLGPLNTKITARIVRIIKPVNTAIPVFPYMHVAATTRLNAVDSA